MKVSAWFLKALNWIAWISAGMGSLFILLGIIQILFGIYLKIAGIERPDGPRLFGYSEIVNFFILSANFFIIMIASNMILYKYQNNKE
ncbi:MAG: hypothetical protein MUO72_09900 [Bacteroidales bacterium]|nr:hypothetical protein [Bacteroidales bacterium]